MPTIFSLIRLHLLRIWTRKESQGARLSATTTSAATSPARLLRRGHSFGGQRSGGASSAGRFFLQALFPPRRRGLEISADQFTRGRFPLIRSPACHSPATEFRQT